MRPLGIARARIGTRGALIVASVAALCLPLAACGAPAGSATGGIETPAPKPSASADASVPVACSLLTPDLIEAATGVAGAREKLNKDLSSPGTSVCEWKGSKADVPTIQVLIANVGSDAGASPGPTPSPAA